MCPERFGVEPSCPLGWLILGVTLTGLRDARTAGRPGFPGVSARAFLAEISIGIGRRSEEQGPCQCVWASDHCGPEFRETVGRGSAVSACAGTPVSACPRASASLAFRLFRLGPELPPLPPLMLSPRLNCTPVFLALPQGTGLRLGGASALTSILTRGGQVTQAGQPTCSIPWPQTWMSFF